MDKPTEAQIEEFWEWCGLVYKTIHTEYPEALNTCEAMTIDRPLVYKGWFNQDGKLVSLKDTPPIDLNNLFKYAPDIIVGVTFRYFPSGCECELTYITEAGFDTTKSWVKNETNDENKSRELSNLALFWAIWEVIHND